MRNLVRIASVWAPPLLVMAVIFWFSSMTAAHHHYGFLHVLWRKVGHFSEYALLFLCWWRALRTRLDGRPALGIAYAITVAYAATDEFHQSFVDGRTATPRDVLIDAAGAAGAAGLVVLARNRRRARTHA
jgi:VanZ family protein